MSDIVTAHFHGFSLKCNSNHYHHNTSGFCGDCFTMATHIMCKMCGMSIACESFNEHLMQCIQHVKFRVISEQSRFLQFEHQFESGHFDMDTIAQLELFLKSKLQCKVIMWKHKFEEGDKPPRNSRLFFATESIDVENYVFYVYISSGFSSVCTVTCELLGMLKSADCSPMDYRLFVSGYEYVHSIENALTEANLSTIRTSFTSVIKQSTKYFYFEYCSSETINSPFHKELKQRYPLNWWWMYHDAMCSNIYTMKEFLESEAMAHLSGTKPIAVSPSCIDFLKNLYCNLFASSGITWSVPVKLAENKEQKPVEQE